MNYLRMAWQEQLLVLHTHRKSLFNMPAIDPFAMHQILRQFPSKQKLLILREVSGAFQLNTQIAKWEETQSQQCDWCGHEVDSRVHRLFECDAFVHIRQKHSEVIECFEPYKEDFALLPVATLHPHHEFHDVLIHAIPPAILPHATVQRIENLQPHGPLRCYTDGSCAHQSSSVTRFASYGIVIDFANSDEERKHHARCFEGTGRTPAVLQRLVCGRLKGIQSIHRAELMAVIWVLETFPTRDVIIYTDNAWVIEVWKKCRLENSETLFLDHPDHDMIRRLTAANVHRLQLHKVKAHQEPLQELDLLNRYHLLGNKEADQVAQWACWNLMPEVVTQLQQIHENHTRDIQLVSQFYKYCLDLQYARAAAQDTQHVAQLDDVGAVPKGDIFQQLADWKVQQSWQFPEVVESRLDRAVWGRHAMTSLLQWFRSCAWPMDDTQESPNSKLGISWTEIAVAVAIKHGMWMPIKRKQQDSLEHIIQPRDLTQCSYLKVTLAEQTANISYMVKHLKSMLMQNVMPTIPQGKVSALLVYGFQGSTGLRIRPQFPEQKQVVQVLRQFFPRTDYMQALPDIDFSDFNFWPEDEELPTLPVGERQRRADLQRRSIRGQNG